jgi:hypothetical protein
MTVIRIAFTLSFILAVLAPAGAQDPVFDIAISIVGEPGARERSLRSFLEAHFRQVHFVDRKSGEPVPPADVVVLDWQQGDYQGGSFPMPKPRSPLGDRADWTIPTVLLGSAGHNLAAAWDVRGGSG